VSPIVTALVVTAAVFRAVGYIAVTVSNEIDRMTANYRTEVPAHVLARMWSE
jgi:hypothetical protein